MLLASAPDAAARNIFEDFSRVPTFTPPAGCIPTGQTYGVLSRCEKTIEPGRTFLALIDIGMDWFGANPSGDAIEIFVTDQVEEIGTYWKQDYPGKNFAFSSKVSDVTPGNAPSRGTKCMEYSIAIEIEGTTGGQPVPAVTRIEGLTCAWRVEGGAPGKPNIEIFWLEAHDEYAPSLGQKPMESFALIVRELFASVRLLVPRAFLVPTDAARNRMREWTESDVNACFGAGTRIDTVAGLVRYSYALGNCKPYFIFRNGKVHSVEGYGSEQECWWVADACERGMDLQEAPRETWQRWTIDEVAACFGEPTEDQAAAFNHHPMRTERDGCSMRIDLEATQRLSIHSWSEAEKGACLRLLHKCEEIRPSKF